jgi:hypothetical protein
MPLNPAGMEPGTPKTRPLLSTIGCISAIRPTNPCRVGVSAAFKLNRQLVGSTVKQCLRQISRWTPALM